ncbi:MAG: hypothetical protein ACRDTG_22085 [Pseudonocardiaceae bacterium]
MSSSPDQLDSGVKNPEPTEWFDLIMRCPACLADEREPGPIGQWYHALDNGTVQIGSSAEYRCLNCQHKEHVQKLALRL